MNIQKRSDSQLKQAMNKPGEAIKIDQMLNMNKSPIPTKDLGFMDDDIFPFKKPSQRKSSMNENKKSSQTKINSTFKIKQDQQDIYR